MADKKMEQPVTTEFEAAGEAQDKTKEIITEEIAKTQTALEEIKTINRLLIDVSQILERARIADYVTMMGRPAELFRRNFLAGMARGFGFGIGFVLISALVITILNSLVANSVPAVARFLSEVLSYMEQFRTIKP